MNLEITGRHIDITEPIRKFATDRVERLRGASDSIMEAHFILTVEKHQRHIAEVNLKTQHEFYHCEEVSTDMYTSIASVLDKIEKQILKTKARGITRTRHGHHGGKAVVSTSSVVEVEEMTGKDMPRIIRTHDVASKPMSVDDAAIAMDGSEHEFLVFKNAETEQVNVVYKRKDGNVGWIEPAE
jgi:putative sigma-54 modulation protein